MAAKHGFKKKSRKAKAPRAIPVSQRIWTRGVWTGGSRWDVLLSDGSQNNGGRGLVGDGSRDNGGGGLIGDGSRNNGGGGLVGDGSRNNGGGGLVGDSNRNIGDEFFGLGYIPDRPDGRDWCVNRLAEACQSESRQAILSKHVRALKDGREDNAHLPLYIDLATEGAFGRVDHQGATQSCTAQAVTSMAEFHFRRLHRRKIQLSRLFLYKVSRELLGVDGDRGSTLRETLKALGKYGCLLEERWPHATAWLERLPRMMDIEEAGVYRALNYYRLDGYNKSGNQTLSNVLHTLAAGLPVAFGFSLFSCIDHMKSGAVIPVPDKSESRVIGAHAVLAVGYKISQPKGSDGNAALTGMLRVRNSWGSKWGDHGYGWLPFEYVSRQLSCDFWAIYPDVAARNSFSKNG